MKSEHIYSQKVKISDSHKIIYITYHSNLFTSWINVKVSSLILLFSVKSDSSTPCNNVLRLKDDTQDITF